MNSKPSIAPSTTCIRRLNLEFTKIQADPSEHIEIARDENNILIWYFLLKKLQDDYVDGEYIGKLSFPPTYPFKAPTIEFITPNGRFACGVKICTTFSHFHPEEWSPEWNMIGMLMGLISFMHEESPESVGSIQCSKEIRIKYAQESLEYNKKLNIYKYFEK